MDTAAIRKHAGTLTTTCAEGAPETYYEMTCPNSLRGLIRIIRRAPCVLHGLHVDFKRRLEVWQTGVRKTWKMDQRWNNDTWCLLEMFCYQTERKVMVPLHPNSLGEVENCHK